MQPRMLLIPLFCVVVSCGPPEEIEPSQKDNVSESDNKSGSAGGRVSSTGSSSTFDWSGQIEILTVWNDFVVGNGEINSGSITLPSDYVLVGGGASTLNVSAGAYITEARPDWPYNTWHVASKSHINSDPHTLRGYAMGLKVQGVSAGLLKSVMTYSSQTSGVANLPSAFVSVASPYLLVGGGAKVNWTGWGNLLVQSRPTSGQIWGASSKDHIKKSPATITVFAIGLQENIPGFGYVDIQKFELGSKFAGSGVCSAIFPTPTGYACASPGANSIYGVLPGGSSCYGRMLMGFKAEIPYGYAVSKDHSQTCNGYLAVNGIFIRKRP